MVRSEVEEISGAVDRITFDVAAKSVAPALEAEPFASICVATDGSPTSRHALAWAARLADAFGSRVTVVRAAEPPGLTTALFDASYDRDAVEQEGHKAAERDAQRVGHGAKARILKGYAVPELTRWAERGECDLVVLGSHGYGKTKRALLGSVADGVKNHVPCHVLVAKAEPKGGRILAAVDGSGSSKYAAKLAIRLAETWDVKCTVFTVVKKATGASVQARIKAVSEVLPKQDVTRWKDRRVDFDILEGDPSRRILETAAQEKSDLIVLGARGLGGLRSAVPGSVANRVSHGAKTSVLIAKPPGLRGRS